ncbi:hypothetical protein LY78DRAFT_199510 [Colletotrichum sublineola]|nr:hypothetical protein LY78DRAFT_199510 [Colletotrichum sublineola]
MSCDIHVTLVSRSGLQLWRRRRSLLLLFGLRSATRSAVAAKSRGAASTWRSNIGVYMAKSNGNSNSNGNLMITIKMKRYSCENENAQAKKMMRERI